MAKVGDKHVARYLEVEMQIEWGSTLAKYQLDVIDTTRGQQICAFTLTHPEATVTLVVSHGNALDAGLFVPFGRHLSNELKVNVCAYDYTVGNGGLRGVRGGGPPSLASTAVRDSRQTHGITRGGCSDCDTPLLVCFRV